MTTPPAWRSVLVICFTTFVLLPAFTQSVTVSPTTISYGNQAAGTSSSVHNVTLKNGQKTTITITSISTNLSDYSQTNNCPSGTTTLAVGATCTISVTFTPSAQGSRNATLTVVDSGTSSPQTTSLTGTGTAPVLKSIAVTPGTASVAAGYTEQFTATGTYSDGSTQNLTTTASWSSTSTVVATVGKHTGLATSVAQGTTTIQATSGSISGSATLTVTAAVMTSISVTPANPSVAAGYTEEFTATGEYSNGTTQNLTSSATWTSSATSVATVNSGGLATGVIPGTATITATSGTFHGSTTLTVTAAVLTSISVTPATASVVAGYTQQYTATGTYSNGTTQSLTNTATWTSSKTSVATVNSSGLATSMAKGTTTIKATSGTISGSATLTVTAAALVSIAISPQNATIALGTTEQFTATGSYSNGTTQNLTTSATWSSTSTAVATIGKSTGLATSVAQGTTTIKATSGSITGSATLTVTAATLTSISVTPATTSIAAGYTQQYTATGTYSNGTTQPLTNTATWTSSATSVATINSSGLATTVAQGATTITATSGGISGSGVLAVTAPVLVSLAINPGTATVAAGYTQQYTATGTYSDGTTQTLTNTVSWSSSALAIAGISGSGLATGISAGTTTITASDGAITATATLTVGAPVLVSIAVTPANGSFALGTTMALTATGTYSDGSTLNLSNAVTWSSGNTEIASVSGQGMVSGVELGSTGITATSGAISGSTTVTVTAAVLVSIAVTPAIPTLPLGTTEQFTATGSYTDGSTQDITSTVQWSSDTPTTATISPAGATMGLASSVGEGTATITATSGAISGSTVLTVTSAALVSIAVTPATPSIALGTTEQFTATGSYTDGSSQNLSSTVQWSTDTPTTATIGTAGATMGLATSVGEGTATITATSGAISGSTVLTVTAAALVSIAINPPTATIANGTTEQFTATGSYTDGSTQDLTQSGHWSSTVATVATISNTTGTAGLASSLGTGTTTIGISAATISATATLVVNPAALVSIAISPQNATIALGTTEQLAATGSYTDGSTQDITTVVTWGTSNTNVATVSNTTGTNGLATSAGQGTATITATSNTIISSTSLTVSGPTLLSITVTPANVAIPLGTMEQFTATGTYTDGSTQDLTNSASWSSSVPAVASVSSSGDASGLNTGSTTISASSGGISAGVVLTVNPAVAVSLVISPATSTVYVGAQQQYTATLNYRDGSSMIVTGSVTWSSSNNDATIGSTGLAIGVASGTSTIEAVWGSNLFTATATLTVSNPTVSVTPVTASILLNGTQQFTASVTGSSNQTVTWNVDGIAGGNSTIGTISSAGLYTPPALIGSHSITAIAQVNSGSVGNASLTVGTLVPVASTFFGMHLHLATSPVPGPMQGTGRIWDSASAQWPNLNTAPNTFVWGNLDSVLADYFNAGINDVMYTLWRVPNWASSNPNDSACDYSNLGAKYYGECDLPTDINLDGTGTDLTWRTWVQGVAQYANGQYPGQNPNYLSNHAHIKYWEPCNECYRSPTLDPGFGTGGASVAYRGTYDQLVRMMQDARCIIIGNSSDPISAMGTTCGSAGYPVTGIDPTALMVMPSGSPLQVGKSYPVVMQNWLYCTCANNSCSASANGCTIGGSAAVDIISAHIYPNNYAPEQIPNQIAKVRAVLDATDLAKPFWNGEGGWGENSTSSEVSDGDPDMDAAFVARFLVMSWASGMVRTYWYQWDNAAYGTLWSPNSISGCSIAFSEGGDICKAGTAYQQVYDWLVGSTLGACDVNGTVWTCTLTQASGAPAEIIWDTSQTCSNGVCTTDQQSVPAIYKSYSDLTGTNYSINGTVLVGIKPILLQTE